MLFYLKLALYISINLFLAIGTCSADAIVDSCHGFNKALIAAQKIRQLELKHNISCKAVDRAEFLSIRKKYLAPLDFEKAKYEELILKTFGIIDQNLDYKTCFSDTNQGDLQAYYQPELKAVVVPNWELTSRDVLVHEIVHAIQDQHFNLLAARKKAASNTDSFLAFFALTEGEARYIQNLYRKHYKLSSLEPHNSLPNSSGCQIEALEQLFYFPYDHGLVFIDVLVNNHDLNILNDLWLKPPYVSKQILYPRRFGLDQLSTPPDFSTLSDPNIIYQDRMGEFFIRTIFRGHIGTVLAIVTAKGWLDDRLVILKKNKRTELQWQTFWESNSDAQDFAREIEKLFRERFAEGYEVNAVANSKISTKKQLLVKVTASKVELVIKNYSKSYL